VSYGDGLGQNASLGTSTTSKNTFKVTHVVDGDTIDVSQGEKVYRVRFIGINTPESVDPRRPVECYGKEASSIMKEIALGKEVELVYDMSKPKQDDNGRELAYVMRTDGVDLGAYMLEVGAAYEYTYKREFYKNQQKYKTIASEAKEMRKGLWAENTCNGEK
jgi:micrococcal nuclease